MVWVPVLRTVSTSRPVPPIDCTGVKLACSTATGKVPLGSCASWRVPPPQPARTAAPATASKATGAAVLLLTALGRYQRPQRRRSGRATMTAGAGPTGSVESCPGGPSAAGGTLEGGLMVRSVAE